MYYNDHAPPHFHALYGDDEATIDITTADTLDGALPRRALSLVKDWAELHRAELDENWDRARNGQPLQRIDPLV